MGKPQIFLDTDIIINWIEKEVDRNSGFKLWKCPFEMLKLVEAEDIIAYTSLTNIFEIRFVLRRKMKFKEERIREFLGDIFLNIHIEIPDSADMLSANQLQDENLLDPFDAIGLSIVKSIGSCILVSRDSDFIQLAQKNDIRAHVPEKFMQIYFSEIFDEVKNDMY